MKSGIDAVVLNETERKAMDALIACMVEIQTWGEKANTSEFIAAIHVIQGFIIQHMLYRLEPTEWSNWYGEQGPRPEGPMA
jgi:hypothetical protein